MSEQNLSAMTVIELRKLAKELHVPLSAGISKQGIIDRLTQATAEAPAAEAAKPAEEPAPAQPDEQEEAPAAAPTPAPGFRPAAPAATSRFNTRPAYQAPAYGSRVSAPRTPAPVEPQRTQTTRPVGFTPRFGPAAQEPAAPVREEERPIRTEPPRPAYQAERRPAYNEAPRLQQRPAYEQPARPAVPEQRPASELPARPAFEQRPAYEQPARSSYEQRPAAPLAAPAASEMLTAAECLDGSGILELHPDGYGFLRSEGMLPSAKDIYVSAAQVRRFALRTGDRVVGKIRPQRDGDKYSAMLYITEVNGTAAEGPVSRPAFEELTPIYPRRRVHLESAKGDTPAVLRLIDLLAPVGFGQRALIQCPPGVDPRELLQLLASAVSDNHPAAAVMALLFNKNPEDVTDLRDQVSCPVLATTFDMTPEHHLRLADMVVEYAARMVEAKRDVVLLVDNLTTLSRVCTTAALQQSRQVLGAVSPQSLQKAKRIFGAARNLREGGSLTVLAIMSSEITSKVDEVILNEFRAASTMELVLDAPLDQKGVKPAISFALSATRRPETFVAPAQLESTKLIRSVIAPLDPEQTVAGLHTLLEYAPSNEELLPRIKDWAAAMKR